MYRYTFKLRNNSSNIATVKGGMALTLYRSPGKIAAMDEFNVPLPKGKSGDYHVSSNSGLGAVRPKGWIQYCMKFWNGKFIEEKEAYRKP